MENNKSVRLLRFCFLGVVVLSLAFVFYNSSIPAEKSNSISTGISQSYNEKVDAQYEHKTDKQKTHQDMVVNTSIRNYAHVLEYIPLGFGFAALFATFIKKIWFVAVTTFMSVLCGFLVAMLDELNQKLFISGRDFEWIDINRDITGVVIGCLMAVAGFFIVKGIALLKRKAIR